MVREIIINLAWRFDGTELGDRFWNIYERLNERLLWKGKVKWK